MAALVTGLFLIATTTLPEKRPADVIAFHPDKVHSNVGFKVRHLGISNVRGAFDEYEAIVRFDPEDLSTLSVEATVDVGSIDTGNERRDNHLRSDDFFNAEEYPTMHFMSKSVQDVEDGQFEIVGDMTIRDVTMEVVLEAEFFGMGMGRDGRKAGFEATTTIDRFDYNLQWDALTETGGLVVGRSVDILLEMELDEDAGDG